MTDTTPPNVTQQERWIVDNPVVSIKAEHRQTGDDTASTYLHLTSSNGKSVCWLESTFCKVARLEIGTYTVAAPNYGVLERVIARRKGEDNNTREVEEYRRLKAKFEVRGNAGFES